MQDADVPSPRTTLELIGHQSAEREFLAAWTSGRVPHAWLITGPRGIGKATLAFRIARFVLSRSSSGGGLFGDVPDSLDTGDDDSVARRIASGGHADLKVLERGWTDDRKTKRKTEIAIEDVRDVGAFLSLTPAEGGWRVVIVDSADEMSRSAANAILKVLEEPPLNALMLLVSHNPGRLLATIRSRCRRLGLHPLPDAGVKTLLGRYIPDLSPDDAALVAGMAEGSVGRALDLCARGGLDLYRDMLALLSGLPRLDVPAAHAFGDRVGSSEDAFLACSDMLLWWLARAAADYARPGAEDRDFASGETGLRRRLVALAGLDRWLALWDKIVYSFDRTGAVNLDRKQVMLNAFLALERACRP